MHNVDFCWNTCFWIHKYIQVQNCGPWGVPCSHCFCNSVKSTGWEWKIMCWGRVRDYEYLAKYSGKFQKYFSIQVNKHIHPPNFQAFATSLDAALRCKTLHYVVRRCKTLHYVALRCTTLHYVALRCTTLSDVALRWKTLHYVERR